jgi:hypothetical protein
MTDKPEGVQLYTDRADFIFADVALGITRKEYDAMQDDDEWKEIPIVYEGYGAYAEPSQLMTLAEAKRRFVEVRKSP